MTTDPKIVAALVQEQLRSDQRFAVRSVRVLADEITKPSDGSFWYLPVSIHRDTENMATIYEALSSIESVLESTHGVRVLLVPRIIPFQKWQDVA
ncbi:MAG: hypothetical protein R3B68_13100 [Phycisphaerales bacterium]